MVRDSAVLDPSDEVDEDVVTGAEIGEGDRGAGAAERGAAELLERADVEGLRHIHCGGAVEQWKRQHSAFTRLYVQSVTAARTLSALRSVTAARTLGKLRHMEQH